MQDSVLEHLVSIFYFEKHYSKATEHLKASGAKTSKYGRKICWYFKKLFRECQLGTKPGIVTLNDSIKLLTDVSPYVTVCKLAPLTGKPLRQLLER